MLVCFLTGLIGIGNGVCEEPPAAMQPATSPEGLEALIRLLKYKGVISLDEARTLLQRLSEDAPYETTLKNEDEGSELEKSVEEIQDQLNQHVDQLLQRDRLTERRVDELESKVLDDIAAKQHKTAWAEKIKLSGDLRLRYQQDFKNKENEDRLGGSGVEPTNIDRQRWRYRARLGVKADLIDPRKVNVGKVQAGLRLSSGNQADPVSTNVTIGDYFNKDNVFFDRAYLKWKWKPLEQIWGGKLPQFEMTAGRMANPFFSTDLVWDSDVNFEGVTMKLTSDIVQGNSWRTFITAGAYPLDEYEFREDGKWLYGFQLGFEHKPFWGLNYKLAAGFYDFQNIKGEPITSIPVSGDLDYDWGEPYCSQGGNTLVDLNRVHSASFDDDIVGLASDYQELNVTAMIDLDRFYPVHVILLADYVINLGYDKDEIRNLYTESEVPDYQLDKTVGYQYGVILGHPKIRSAGEWSASFMYKYLEADAVLDAFTDSDFNMGGTDAEGYIVKLQVGLYKNVWFSMRYLSTNEIIEEYGQFAVDTLQVDINAEF
jgi:hypothetical protein